MIVLTIVGYAVIGIAVGAYSRNRSINKHFKHWYNFDKFGYATEEYHIERAMERVKEYDSSDIAAASILGTIFWPVFLIGFICHFLWIIVASLLTTITPKSAPEKRLAEIMLNRQLQEEKKAAEKELAAAIRLLEKNGIKKEHLYIAESNRIK